MFITNLARGCSKVFMKKRLCMSLRNGVLSVERQLEVPIMYKGVRLKTELRLDLLVEGQVIVELKSVKELQDVFFKQTLTYCKLLDKRLGILVNFNTSNIRENIRRVIN